jgi:hypothetical protein
MSSTLFSILAALLLVTATACRGARFQQLLPTKKNIPVPQWDFRVRMGAGSGRRYLDLLEPEKEKEVKQVKREKCLIPLLSE